MRTYRIKAIWKTLQGEGFFAGRPAVFVRFVGCNLWSGQERDRARDAQRTGADCPRWCDTDFRKEGSRPYTAPELIAALQEIGGPIRFCVLTGGEPLLQLDAPLMQALRAAGYFVAIETNGTISLRQACTDPATGQLIPPDWIVCSPKLPEDRLALEYFDELKLIVPDYRPEQYARFARRARPHRVGGRRIPLLWLQPEDGPHLAEAQRCAVELALTHPEWRVSVQIHKVLGVD